MFSKPTKQKKSFFERLTGAVNVDYDEYDDIGKEPEKVNEEPAFGMQEVRTWEETHEDAVGELAIDLYQSGNDIIIKAMVAGVRPEDLEVSITRDSVTISGKREESRRVTEGDYLVTELYWGAFSRTIALPEEVDVEEAEATEHHGLLMLKLPKIDKGRQTRLRVKGMG